MFELRVLLSKLEGDLPSEISWAEPPGSIDAGSPDPDGDGFQGSKSDVFSFIGLGRFRPSELELTSLPGTLPPLKTSTFSGKAVLGVKAPSSQSFTLLSTLQKLGFGDLDLALWFFPAVRLDDVSNWLFGLLALLGVLGLSLVELDSRGTVKFTDMVLASAPEQLAMLKRKLKGSKFLAPLYCLKIRYQQQFLGHLWMIYQPVSQTFRFSICVDFFLFLFNPTLLVVNSSGWCSQRIGKVCDVAALLPDPIRIAPISSYLFEYGLHDHQASG